MVVTDPSMIEAVSGVGVEEEENGSMSGAQEDNNGNRSDKEEDTNDNGCS